MQNIVILISGPSLLYVFKKWSEFTLKVVRVYLKSGPSLPGPSLLVLHRCSLSLGYPKHRCSLSLNT